MPRHNLALLVLKVPLVNQAFNAAKVIVVSFINFSDKGAEFVFGNLERPGDLALNPGKEFLFMFAFKALPPILFVSAFFTVLYHYGVLQRIVRLMVVYINYGADPVAVLTTCIMACPCSLYLAKLFMPERGDRGNFALIHFEGAGKSSAAPISTGVSPRHLATSPPRHRGMT